MYNLALDRGRRPLRGWETSINYYLFHILYYLFKILRRSAPQTI